VDSNPSRGGWLQINFLRELTPIGQYNAFVGDVGIVEAGGNGKWQCKQLGWRIHSFGKSQLIWRRIRVPTSSKCGS
jgi:hypothetical protein